LIWDQVGTGCQTFSLLILEKNYRLLWAYKMSPAYRVYYGIDDFITLPII
jgi:hypothetical protein